jgi:hypothetical protein
MAEGMEAAARAAEATGDLPTGRPGCRARDLERRDEQSWTFPGPRGENAGRSLSDQVIRETPASRGTEASADVLIVSCRK